MEFALATVTVLSLLMTLAMGVVTWRLVREERRRSTARLAALAAELQPDAAPAPPPGPAPTASTARVAPRPPSDPEASIPNGTPAAEADRASRPDAPVAFGDLFGAPAPSTSTPATRVAALAVAAILVVGCVGTVLLVLSAGADDPTTTAGSPRPPVELLALDHATEGPVLAISGAVRNPNGAVTADHLSVVAMAFDEAGTLVASERSPVARLSLPPGTASAFAVEVPATGVSRYRISFLIDDATVPHVDRRIAPRAAATGEPS